MVRYVYTGQLHITRDNAVGVFHLALIWQMEKVVDWCASWITCLRKRIHHFTNNYWDIPRRMQPSIWQHMNCIITIWMVLVLLDRLNADNLEQIWQSARCSKNEMLLQTCREYVVKNLQKLGRSGFVTKMKEHDFKRILKLAISEGMEETAALTTLVEWIKASPDRQYTSWMYIFFV